MRGFILGRMNARRMQEEAQDFLVFIEVVRSREEIMFYIRPEVHLPEQGNGKQFRGSG